MSSKVYMYKVEMSCDGCATSISNVLIKHKDKGIETFDVDLNQKLVSVTSTLDAKSVTEILQKTGKDISFVGEKK